MSATHRSRTSGTDHERHADDAYVTEARVVDALLREAEEALSPPESFGAGDYTLNAGRPVLTVHPWANYSVVDAGAGTGSILRRFRERGILKSVGVEYRSDLSNECLQHAPCVHASFFDVVAASLAEQPGCLERPNLVVMNPPYNLALEFVEAALKWVRTTKSRTTGERRYATVAALLRIPWMASRKREEFHREHPSTLWVIPDRPSFTGDNKVDATDYAWFIWSKDPRIPMGAWKVIPVAHKDPKPRRPRHVVRKDDPELAAEAEAPSQSFDFHIPAEEVTEEMKQAMADGWKPVAATPEMLEGMTNVAVDAAGGVK